MSHASRKLLAAVVLLIFSTSVILFGFDYLTGSAGFQAQQSGPAAPPSTALDPAVADTATFAGGCFWCMEPPFDTIEGVAATISGYAGGSEPNPTYDEVSSGTTGHAESVQVIYDSTKVGYEHLLMTYWHNVDPLDDGGQFCDRGTQYRPVIFVRNAHQRRLAQASKEQIAGQFSQPIVVPIEQLNAFYRAEEYHQNFYKKNPVRYKTYRRGCGRDARLRELWGQAAGHASAAADTEGS